MADLWPLALHVSDLSILLPGRKPRTIEHRIDQYPFNTGTAAKS